MSWQLWSGWAGWLSRAPPHNTFTYGPSSHFPCVFFKSYSYWLGCPLNANCFSSHLMVWSKLYLLLSINLLKLFSLFKSLAINSYLFCFRKFWNLYSKIRNAVIFTLTQQICFFWRLSIPRIPFLGFINTKRIIFP